MRHRISSLFLVGVSLIVLGDGCASAQTNAASTKIAETRDLRASISRYDNWCEGDRAILIMTLQPDSPLAAGPKTAAEYLSRAVPAIIASKKCNASNAVVAVMKDNKRIGVLTGKGPTWTFVKSQSPDKELSSSGVVDLDENPSQPSITNPVRR